jgi:hypothetical protein
MIVVRARGGGKDKMVSERTIDVKTQMRFPVGTSKVHRRYISEGAEMNTGKSELHSVYVHDARGEECTLDVTGFQLFEHKSKVFSWGSG